MHEYYKTYIDLCLLKSKVYNSKLINGILEPGQNTWIVVFIKVEDFMTVENLTFAYMEKKNVPASP